MIMFPSECLFERRVRSDDDEDLDATDLPLFVLECKERMADGYADDKLEIYNERLEDMVIGARLADAPPAVSYLAILDAPPRMFAEIVAVDKAVIVIRLDFRDEDADVSYLIYDAVALSLRMIPKPEDHFCSYYPLSSTVSLARPALGSDDDDYALIKPVRQDTGGNGDYLLMWRPSSSSWSEYKKAILPDCIDWSVNRTHKEFSFNGNAYWVDLLSGVSYCSCDALFNDNCRAVKFGSHIPLPVPPGGHRIDNAQPAAYRTIGVVCDSFIRFVSISGFQDYVPLKDRTVTVWKRLGHNRRWQEEYNITLETLRGFQGFDDDLPKDLTPMYPLLSTEDPNVVYLVLCECSDTGTKIYPSHPRCLLAVDMRNKIVSTFDPQDGEEDWLHKLISCGFSPYLHKALVGPCDDDGIPIEKPRMKKCTCCGGTGRVVAKAPIPIPMKKKRRRDGNSRGNNVADQAPIRVKKKHRRCVHVTKLLNILKRWADP